ncbi:MAG: hypothetical protein KBS66_05360 [Eubacterium sp.]|nr:hypothetical protein [Candidatus Colimonas fimequi]
MIETRILEPKYTPREALVLLLHTDPNLEIEDIEDVYYPYVRMRFELTVGTGRFVKQLVKYVDCIIDRVLGTAYDTVYDKDSEGKPIYRDVEIDEEDCLDPVLSEDEYHAKGHDFALKQYIGRAKLMFTPKFNIIEEEKFYKHFYVVTCRDKEGRIYFIMVDAVDGGISILDHEAHIDELAKIGDYNQLQMLAGDAPSDEEYEYEDDDETEEE